MNNNLQVFSSPEFGAVSIMDIDGKIYFPATECAEILGYANPHDALDRHCRCLVKHEVPHPQSPDKTIEKLFIPEGDLYRLIARSKLPKAEQFERWVFDEILPAIRKHGAYVTPAKLEDLINDPDTMINLLQQLKSERQKAQSLKISNNMLQVEVATLTPKADYFDELVDRNLLTNFRDTAKQLHVKPKQFIDSLIAKDFIYRDAKGDLKPKSKKNAALFEVKECYNDKTKWRGTQTLVTPRGRETFRLLFQ